MKNLILSLGFSFLLFFDLFSQSQFQEEYEVINEEFNPSDFKVEGEFIEVYYKTSELRFWVSLLRSEDSFALGKDCIDVSAFIDGNFSEIEKRVHDIPNLRLDPSKLDGRIKLTERDEPKVRKITFPLIIENYAFLLMYNDSDQLVVVLRKNEKGEWRNACNLILYNSPLIDYIPITK